MDINTLKTIREYSKTTLLILGVMLLGTFAVNEVLEYNYRSQFLQAPCSLCEELNPGVIGMIEYKPPAEAGKLNLNLPADFFNLSSQEVE